MSHSVRSAAAKAWVATPLGEAHISVGECSTHPGCGKIWPIGRCAIDTTSPASSITIALELVVPWSSARMYFLFAKSLSHISSRGIKLPIQVRKRCEQLYLICIVSSSGKQILILVPSQECVYFGQEISTF